MDEKQYNKLVELIEKTKEEIKGTKEGLGTTKLSIKMISEKLDLINMKIDEVKEKDKTVNGKLNKRFDTRYSITKENTYFDELREKDLKEMKEEGRLLQIEHAINELDKRLKIANL